MLGYDILKPLVDLLGMFRYYTSLSKNWTFQGFFLDVGFYDIILKMT